jgi:flagellar M-ring protein FliF
MKALRIILARLSTKQKILIGAVALMVVVGLVVMARWNKSRDYKPLYSGLATEDAAAVVARLKESAVDYRLGENGSAVLVPSAKVAELRLQLAAAGLPKSGRIGFELFDKTNFGTTDFAEQVNYHRALEGELERSIGAIQEVEQSRVHLTFAKDSVFTESRQPAKASVMVKLKTGARLSKQNVQAITYLVGSAVEGLDPEAVSVLDMRGNLLSNPKKKNPNLPDPDDGALEYRAKIEKDLLAKVNTTLEPLLGAPNFRAVVSVECDFVSGEQSEETFDPGKSVMTSSQKSEDTMGASSTAGIPGTASALPRPAPRGTGANTTQARRSENITYQTSRTVKHLKLPQGDIRRISASVLVDHQVRWEGSGPQAKRVVTPLTPERLKAIRDVVAGVVGFRQERGDQVVVESQPFEQTLAWQPPAPPPTAAAPAGKGNGAGKGAPAIGFQLPFALPKWATPRVLMIAGGGLAALLVLLVGFLVMKRRRAKKKAGKAKATVGGAPELPGGERSEAVQDAKAQLEARLAEQAAKREQAELEAMAALQLPPPTTKKSEVLARHLSDEARKNPEVMAQVLRTWMNEGEK